MRLELDDGDDDPGINMTPMIDMTFLLLIFFLAATTFAKDEVELDLRLPEAQSGVDGDTAHPLVISVLADGRIMLGGRETTLPALQQQLQAAAGRNREQGVLVRGDKLAQFGVGLQVLDACRLAKLGKVDFAALPSGRN
jgi:biopolymer transport protein ExbD